MQAYEMVGQIELEHQKGLFGLPVGMLSMISLTPLGLIIFVTLAREHMK